MFKSIRKKIGILNCAYSNIKNRDLNFVNRKTFVINCSLNIASIFHPKTHSFTHLFIYSFIRNWVNFRGFFLLFAIWNFKICIPNEYRNSFCGKQNRDGGFSINKKRIVANNEQQQKDPFSNNMQILQSKLCHTFGYQCRYIIC